MELGVPDMASATPAVFSLPSPREAGHFFAESCAQMSVAAAFRYRVKFSVVPDSSAR